MGEHEKPEWERFDSVRSIVAIGKTALAEVIAKVDTYFADKINGDNDEI